VWPYLHVEPRKYRLRILNAANSRFYNLTLSEPFVTMHQIASDADFFPNSVPLEWILLGPAERADIIIDFSLLPIGATIDLLNTARSPFYNNGSVLHNRHLRVVMRFIIEPLTSNDPYPVLRALKPLRILTLNEVSRNFTIEFNEERINRGDYTEVRLTLNKLAYMDPITEIVQRGSVVLWNLINLTPVTHPMHFHLVPLQILDRRPFNVSHYLNTSELIFTGELMAHDINEYGWRDTVKTYPRQVTRILIHYSSQFVGEYIYHCHILEHEDNDMMRPFVIVP